MVNTNFGIQQTAAPAKPVRPATQKSASATAEPKNFSDVLSGQKVRSSDVQAQRPERQTEADETQSQGQTERLANQSSASQMDKNKIKPVTREAALNVFLEKMNSELGVEASQVLQAFAELSPSEMLAPPEESAGQVLENLGLTGEEKDKAFILYQDMLAMTAAAGMSTYLENNKATANVQVMTEKQLRQQKLSSSLDSMNDRFFMAGQHASMQQTSAAKSPEDVLAAPVTQVGLQSYNTSSTGTRLSDQNNPILSQMNPALAQSENSVLEESGNDLFMTSDINDANTDDLASEFGMALPPREIKRPAEARSTLEQLQMQQILNQKSEPMVKDQSVPTSPFQAIVSQDAMTDGKTERTTPESFFMPFDKSQQSLQSHVDPVVSQALPAAFGAEVSAEMGGKGEGNEESSEFGDFSSVQPADVHSAKQGSPSAQSFMMTAPTTGEADVKENVKEIINQAQFLAKKGGGEMKVTLSPEGIGEVNLKVKMTNGQVNVEMVTSNDEAKKILEKGLGELKESLASHKLHLDSVKIEHAKDLSNQLNDQRQDLERSFQQKFLSDFRNGNQFKNEFFAQPTPRVPGSQTKDQAANAVYDSGKKSRNLSRRLDLVA